MEVISPEERAIKCYKIRQKFPRVFFQRCVKCGYEYRKTYMWSWVSWCWPGDASKVYGCMRCFPNYQDVLKHLEISIEAQGGEI